MSPFRVGSILFAAWGLVFVARPYRANELAGLAYTTTGHTEDWTRIAGLFCLAFAALLESAHRSDGEALRRTTARVVLAFAVPCAVIMAWWQLVPDPRWSRWDLVNVGLLVLLAVLLAPAARRAK